MTGRDVEAELAALQRVQRRVGAIAFLAVAMHGVVGLAVVAHVVHGQGRASDAVLLLVMSAVVGVITCVVVRVILARPPVSVPWLVVGVAPSILGALWIW